MASNRSDLTTVHGRNMKLLLQAVVRSTQWTYSIFWRFSPSKGLLVWRDGFYNGDVKRSLQLRELFHSLKFKEETSQPFHKQCAALSPDDLTDIDWFYLVSMSYDFAPANGLPGRALVDRCPVWLCRANEVEGRVFSRALLAKSASIQTVVCIPLTDGVLELGVTKLVPEDPGLIEHVKSFFLDDAQQEITSETSSSKISSDFNTGEDFIQARIESNMSEDITTGSSRCQKRRNEGWTSEHCKDGAFSKWIEKGHTAMRTEPALARSRSKLKNKFTGGEDVDSELSDDNKDHVLAERRRRNKINHKFNTLRSIVPFVTKTDKESILGEAIKYLKHLQGRVLELESHNKQTELDQNDFQEQNPNDRAIVDKQDEKLSDEKYFKRVKKLRDADKTLKSPRMDERKVRVVEGTATSPMKTVEGSMAEIEVSINGERALVEFKCCWKKGLLLQIMQTLNSLQLEIYDLQSSRVQHNYFVATIKAMVLQQVWKTRNGKEETIARLKEAIQRVVL